MLVQVFAQSRGLVAAAFKAKVFPGAVSAAAPRAAQRGPAGADHRVVADHIRTLSCAIADDIGKHAACRAASASAFFALDASASAVRFQRSTSAERSVSSTITELNDRLSASYLSCSPRAAEARFGGALGVTYMLSTLDGNPHDHHIEHHFDDIFMYATLCW